MKSIFRVLLVFVMLMIPSLVKAQGDLAAFDLKGKVKQCIWVNHKAGCIYKGFCKVRIRKCSFFHRMVVA